RPGGEASARVAPAGTVAQRLDVDRWRGLCPKRTGLYEVVSDEWAGKGVVVGGDMNSSKLIVSWNLARVAADLATFLKFLEGEGALWDTDVLIEEYLQPYILSADDLDTVLGLAWKKRCLCIDCGRLWDSYNGPR